MYIENLSYNDIMPLFENRIALCAAFSGRPVSRSGCIGPIRNGCIYRTSGNVGSKDYGRFINSGLRDFASINALLLKNQNVIIILSYFRWFRKWDRKQYQYSYSFIAIYLLNSDEGRMCRVTRLCDTGRCTDIFFLLSFSPVSAKSVVICSFLFFVFGRTLIPSPHASRR